MPELVALRLIKDPTELAKGEVLSYIDASFIIKVKDMYWKTMAVLPYRLADAVSPIELAGVNHIIRLFDSQFQVDNIHVAVPYLNPDFAESCDRSTGGHGGGWQL